MVDPVPTPADPVVPVQPPIPVSPTGLAWIPANITKIIGLVIAIALAVLVVLMKSATSPIWQSSDQSTLRLPTENWAAQDSSNAELEYSCMLY